MRRYDFALPDCQNLHLFFFFSLSVGEDVNREKDACTVECGLVC